MDGAEAGSDRGSDRSELLSPEWLFMSFVFFIVDPEAPRRDADCGGAVPLRPPPNFSLGGRGFDMICVRARAEAHLAPPGKAEMPRSALPSWSSAHLCCLKDGQCHTHPSWLRSIPISARRRSMPAIAARELEASNRAQDLLIKKMVTKLDFIHNFIEKRCVHGRT